MIRTLRKYLYGPATVALWTGLVVSGGICSGQVGLPALAISALAIALAIADLEGTAPGALRIGDPATGRFCRAGVWV